jgi:hypothetical protein
LPGENFFTCQLGGRGSTNSWHPSRRGRRRHLSGVLVRQRISRNRCCGRLARQNFDEICCRGRGYRLGFVGV